MGLIGYTVSVVIPLLLVIVLFAYLVRLVEAAF
jgi:hypothetical protein